MLSRSCTVLLLVAVAAQSPHLACAQPGQLPWRAGDAAPIVAGARLGASVRVIVDSGPGRPDSVEIYHRDGPTITILHYWSRGLSLYFTGPRGAPPPTHTLAFVQLLTPQAGDLGGVRVGDMRESVLARWGPPTGGDPGAWPSIPPLASLTGADLYTVGTWRVFVQLDRARRRVEFIGLALATSD